MVDPVTAAITAALIAGATTGVTEVYKKAISDGYNRLKALINKKFVAQSEVTDAIGKLESKPESVARQQVLAEELKAINVSADSELMNAAQLLLELIKVLPQGDQHIQKATGTGIAQADRGSVASVTFVDPSPEVFRVDISTRPFPPPLPKKHSD